MLQRQMGDEEETPRSIIDIDMAAWSDHVMPCIFVASTFCRSHLSVKNISDGSMSNAYWRKRCSVFHWHGGISMRRTVPL